MPTRAAAPVSSSLSSARTSEAWGPYPTLARSRSRPEDSARISASPQPNTTSALAEDDASAAAARKASTSSSGRGTKCQRPAHREAAARSSRSGEATSTVHPALPRARTAARAARLRPSETISARMHPMHRRNRSTA